jgi:Domain of unknown function (DUF4157)
MTGLVIQGYFVGGRQRVAAAAPKVGLRPPGPPAPIFASRPGLAQRHGGNQSFAVDPTRLGLANGGGKKLPDTLRGQMEAALGADFSAVRVHVGPQAERIGAIAFTMGTDLYFAPGRFQPDTAEGKQLLGHELVHVVQQRAGRVRCPAGAGLAVVQNWALENEADCLGRRAAAYRPLSRQLAAPGATRRAPLAPPASAPTVMGNESPHGASLHRDRLARSPGPAREAQLKAWSAKRAPHAQAKRPIRPACHPSPGSARVLQPRYYFYSNGNYVFYNTPASLTPGIRRRLGPDGQQETHHEPGSWFAYGVWESTAEAAVAHVVEVGERVVDDVGQIGISVIRNDQEAASSIAERYPLATKAISIVGKAALAGGILLVGGLIAGKYISWALPPEVQSALTFTTLGLALARGAKHLWDVRKARRNDQAVWQIRFRDGVTAVISASLFAIEMSKFDWGFAIFGWQSELYDFVKWVFSCVSKCCAREGEHEPLILPT